MKVNPRALFFLIVITLFSCKKDKVPYDYRQDYVGNFKFTMISEFSGPNGSGTDTTYFDGFIRYYVDSDTLQNFILDDYSVSSEVKIVIQLDAAHILYTVLNEDGTFVERSDASFSQSGHFDASKNSLVITRYVNSPATFDAVTHTITGVRY